MNGEAESAWPSWQQEYRYGAFYLFPPADVTQVVNELRERYDPVSAAICGAHVTLSEPLSATFTDSQHDELSEILARVSAFDVHFGPLTSLGTHPGVVFALRPVPQLDALRTAIHSATFFAHRREHPRAQHAAHMTVAEFISPGESQKLLAALRDAAPSGRFRCDRVTYAVPDASFLFQPVATLELGSGRNS